LLGRRRTPGQAEDLGVCLEDAVVHKSWMLQLESPAAEAGG
jgi:hypothetical protein